MPEAENQALPKATNDSWRSWLMTGARRNPIDRRRMRGAHKGLKKMLIEGVGGEAERPHAWKDFSGAMVRHAVDEALRSLPSQEKHVVTLAYFGGLSNRDIAHEVGLTEATVQRRLRRALATISDHIQHGRALGRRAMYALTIWLSARWLSDSAHHVAQVATVAAAAAIIVTQPTPATVMVPRAGPASPPTKAHATTVVPPVPSPTAAAVAVPGAVPEIQPPVAVPVTIPPVTLPSLPPLPAKIKPAV